MTQRQEEMLGSFKKKDVICILCPKGCPLTVAGQDKKGNPKITGAECKEGKEYALQEITDPRRVITTSIVVTGGRLPLASVRTSVAIPKDTVLPCLEEIRKVTLGAPIHIGDIIVPDVLGTGANIIATRDVAATQ